MADEPMAAQLEQLRLENEQLAEIQRAAEDERDRYLDSFQSSPLPTLTLDSIGLITEANQAARRILAEIDDGAVSGRRLRRLICDEDQARVAEHLRCCSASDTPVTCTIRTRNGIPLQLWSQRKALEQRLHTMVILDLRENDRAQQENHRLLQAEQSARAANEAKDRFIGVLSHELRTPLTPVLAAVTQLAERADIPASLQATFDMIRRNVLIEARLIDDLLDVTRISSGKLRLERRPTDVHQIVLETIEMLSPSLEGRGLSIGVFLDAEQHFANADPVRLKQVLWNLVRNAIHFTNAGGRIELRSWNSVATSYARVAIEVSDTGQGFDPSMSRALFEPFEQGPERGKSGGGLGLGLAICRGIMDLHGGGITAFSRGPNLGARFVIDMNTTALAPVATPSYRSEPPSNLRRILLVDDHEDTVQVFSELLRDAGYEVRTASSVESALAADLDQIDMIVSDIGLGEQSGLDLMRSINETRQIKGVAMSGYGTEEDVKASKAAGFVGHLTKPIEFNVLLSTIQDVLRAS